MSSVVEYVVLLDESGAAVGTAPKADVHHASTPLHLAFSCYVFDPEGRLLLTQRAHHKPTWGGVWTNSCCGHPAPGERLEAAVRRRVGQELGLALGEVRLLLPAFRYRAVMEDGTVENEMCPVFVATSTADPEPDPEEVTDVEWVDWATFREQVFAGSRDISPWCIEQVRELPPHPLSAPSSALSLLPPAAVIRQG